MAWVGLFEAARAIKLGGNAGRRDSMKRTQLPVAGRSGISRNETNCVEVACIVVVGSG